MKAAVSPEQHAPRPSILSHRARRSLLILWCATLISIVVWTHVSESQWDAKIYWKAVDSIHLGHDPYADGIAVQQLAHIQNHGVPSPSGPFSYVYSPITLPILRLANLLPVWLVAAAFWLSYLAGVCGELWFSIQSFDSRDLREPRYFAFLIPVAVFFPGFLASDIILSGNIAFMLYGMVLAATVLAWRSGRWRWFYLAVLIASCVKAPLLSLLVLPILSARRQWIPASLTAVAGLGLFATQPLIWPTLFRNYLQAVELQFSYNRDFGFSPAGIFSGILWDHHIPYSPASAIFYLLYALPLFGFLFFLSRRYLRGDFTLTQWAPVLLVGTILLNPRLIEYDAAPLALPLALIAWRFFALTVPRRPLLCFILLFAVANIVAQTGWQNWKLTEGSLLIVFFAAGSWTLLRPFPVQPLGLRPEDESALLPA